MTPQTVNADPATGIHFGVISYHSVTGDALDTVFEGTNLSFESAVEEIKSRLRFGIRKVFRDIEWEPRESQFEEVVLAAWEAIEDDFNQDYQSEDEQFLYEGDGYKITNSPSLVCLFIEKSPYYTYTERCSPCVPNAGDLDNPDLCHVGSLKTYCLGHDWFEGGKAPYPVMSVEHDGFVMPEAK